MQSLNYPVMLISPNYLVGKIISEKELTIVGEVQYEKGCFDNCYIIDSKGCKYSVVSTSKIKKLFSIFNYNKFYRKVLVFLELSESINVNFDEFRELILDMIIKQHWYGEDIGISNETELRAWFSEADSFKKLIMLSDTFS